MGALEFAHLGPLNMTNIRFKWVSACWLLAVVPAVTFAQNRYWCDGSVTRPLWQDPFWVADFSTFPADPASVLRMSGTSDRPDHHQSPVFRDAANSQGQARALPGGVLLRFRANQGDAAQALLAATHGIRLTKGIGTSGRFWLVASGPGLESLELANRLCQSGDFESAAPNWWLVRALK